MNGEVLAQGLCLRRELKLEVPVAHDEMGKVLVSVTNINMTTSPTSTSNEQAPQLTCHRLCFTANPQTAPCTHFMAFTRASRASISARCSA